MMSRKAFTLVELLVVIAIIGLLSTVAVVSLGSARVKSRNTKRIADVKQLVTAFALARDASASGAYPTGGGDAWYCLSTTCVGAWSGVEHNATVDAFYQLYMPTIPTDPAGGTRGYAGYVYDGSWAGGVGFPAGSYISFTLEPPATCTIGKIYSSDPNTVQCEVKLD